jgi:2-C-methyl-D-erythritol 4-phosphate cytidylyltransferase/2-C-methyl-D-erythritol 2,4-cyclodiphosphate synthase
MSACVALIVAAGRGTRVGGPLPKQYRSIGGEPMLRRTVQAFRRHPRVSHVRVVIHRGDRPLYDAAMAGLDLLPPIEGGETRQESVRRGLESLTELAPGQVLIHDGARPFVTSAIIDRVLDGLARASGAIAALPLTDTIKRATAGETAIRETVERQDLWRAQTPQGFRFDAILAAHRAADAADLTDDAAVAAQANLEVIMVPGSEENAKITTDEDLRRAEHAADAALELRVGQGFDVHRFAPGDGVRLCGVRIPHGQRLEGHSDADVGLHAATDAILGALAAGDIGQHFPPSDPRWRDADSSLFLRHAADLVIQAGGRVVHVDVTLICEAPRIGPHREAMVRRLAEILGLEPGRCSVKATTTERLGFTGRGEGIAAQAIATIRFPPRS